MIRTGIVLVAGLASALPVVGQDPGRQEAPPHLVAAFRAVQELMPDLPVVVQTVAWEDRSSPPTRAFPALDTALASAIGAGLTPWEEVFDCTGPHPRCRMTREVVWLEVRERPTGLDRQLVTLTWSWPVTPDRVAGDWAADVHLHFEGGGWRVERVHERTVNLRRRRVGSSGA